MRMHYFQENHVFNKKLRNSINHNGVVFYVRFKGTNVANSYVNLQKMKSINMIDFFKNYYIKKCILKNKMTDLQTQQYKNHFTHKF